MRWEFQCSINSSIDFLISGSKQNQAHAFNFMNKFLEEIYEIRLRFLKLRPPCLDSLVVVRCFINMTQRFIQSSFQFTGSSLIYCFWINLPCHIHNTLTRSKHPVTMKMVPHRAITHLRAWSQAFFMNSFS